MAFSGLQAQILRAAKVVQDAKALIITCGAGMGVDSGMPDFRGKDGFWQAFPLLKDKNIRLQDMSTPQWFETDPDFAWGFFGYRYNLYSKTTPHDGFKILHKWGHTKQYKYFAFTSNVDGHFQKAGYDANRIVECHGSIHHLQCTDPSVDNTIWDMPSGVEFTVDDQLRCKPPHQTGPPGKNEPARPNILMFGDWSWVEDRTAAQHQRYNKFVGTLRADIFSSTVIVEIGAGKAVPTVRLTSEELLHSLPNATLIRINKSEDDSDVPDGQISLTLGGLEALKLIDEAMQ